jgi:hypothetical protein
LVKSHAGAAHAGPGVATLVLLMPVRFFFFTVFCFFLLGMATLVLLMPVQVWGLGGEQSSRPETDRQTRRFEFLACRGWQGAMLLQSSGSCVRGWTAPALSSCAVVRAQGRSDGDDDVESVWVAVPTATHACL